MVYPKCRNSIVGCEGPSIGKDSREQLKNAVTHAVTTGHIIDVTGTDGSIVPKGKVVTITVEDAKE